MKNKWLGRLFDGLILTGLALILWGCFRINLTFGLIILGFFFIGLAFALLFYYLISHEERR